MKIFTKKGILQKTIILITMVLSINFIMPTYSHADMGGVLLTPVTDLVAAIGDVVVGLLQGCMNLSTDENFFANNNAFMVDGGDFDTTKYPKSKITGDEQTKENISTDDLDKGWFSNGDDYQIPVSKLSPEEIFSGQVAALDVNFISPNKYTDNDGETINSSAQILQKTIAQWYVALRNLTIVGLLSVLVYVAIRIIISSTAQDKAKYKQMFTDWLIALCLLFFLHYIMSFILTLTESINTAIMGNASSSVAVSVDGTEKFSTNLMGLARFKVQYKNIGPRVMFLIIYIALVIYTAIFTFFYLKRLLMMAFLTIIAPLVAITYPIDKISDGKAQAFNMWLKEYTFNALIQPFHLIMYMVFVGSALDLAAKNPVYCIAAMGFILPAEKILRKFFGFDKAGATMGALTGFAAGNVMGSLKKIGSGGGKASGGASSSQGAEKPIRYQGKHNAGDLDEKELGKAVGTKEKSKLGNGESEDRYEQFKEELNNPENHQNSNSNEEMDYTEAYMHPELYDSNNGNPATLQTSTEQYKESTDNPELNKVRQDNIYHGKEDQDHMKQGLKNLWRAHGTKPIKRAAKFAAKATFSAAAGTIGGAIGLASGKGLGGVMAGATAGAALGSGMVESASHIPQKLGNTGRNITRTVGREMDIFNGNTEHQDRRALRDFKTDKNNVQYIKDMMAKENGGALPSSKEIQQRMDTFDPYISEGLTDVKDITRAQKAEQYGVSSKQSAVIAALAKERNITAGDLGDSKKYATKQKDLAQEFMNKKGVSEKQATQMADRTLNIMKVQNGQAHDLKKMAAPTGKTNTTSSNTNNTSGRTTTRGTGTRRKTKK